MNLEVNFDFREILNYKGSNIDRQWTIDPIDGTKGFMEGLVYAVGISLFEESGLKIVVIGVPHYNNKGNAIFLAEKEHGTKVSYGGKDFKSLKVSDQQNLKESVLYHSQHYDKKWVEDFADLVGIKQRIQIDSMSKFCKVTDGSADLYLKPIDMVHSYSWDYAPGSLIIREVGGEISDLKGMPIHFLKDKLICSTPGLVASNSKLQLDIIKNLLKIKF